MYHYGCISNNLIEFSQTIFTEDHDDSDAYTTTHSGMGKNNQHYIYSKFILYMCIKNILI